LPLVPGQGIISGNAAAWQAQSSEESHDIVNERHSCVSANRRGVLRWGLCSALAAVLWLTVCLSGCGRKQARGEGPNLVIISVDTLRADHVSCYGYKRETTPNIDHLASQGHRFDSVYTTVPTTLPAHASLFTSLYPSQLSVRRNGEAVPAGVVTLAQILETSGYTTGGFVSAIPMDARYGLGRGFQTYVDVGGDERLEIPAEETLSKATRWLKRSANEQFFLFVHFYDPHTWYHAPERFRKKLGAPDEQEPPGRQFVPNPDEYTPERVEEIIAAYDAEIAYADWAVGELLRELVRAGVEDNTVVVVLSDHGESLDELLTRYGYGFDHGEFLYAHQLEIPLIIRTPEDISQGEGIVHGVSVSILDVMPTILDILQIGPPESMEGRSLVPMLRGEPASHEPIFSERRAYQEAPKPYLAAAGYSVIEAEWHVISSGGGAIELYNLLDDPGEVSDLGGEHEKVETLRSELQQWVARLKPLFGPSMFETDKEAIEGLRDLGYAK
jgi:arylsulfatase A-like enzyme